MADFITGFSLKDKQVIRSPHLHH